MAGKPLRLWPGVLIVALQWVARFVVPIFAPEAGAFGAIAGFLLGPVFIVWWAFFSRARPLERWGGVALMVLALAGVSRLLHPSIATGGMGMLFWMYAIPALCLAFIVWAVAARRLAPGPRLATMAATILVACGGWALVRTNGVSGTGSDFEWRWSRTAEERLLARGGEAPQAVPTAAVSAAMAAGGADWPGFRGPERDDVVPGVRIETDWSQSPPLELWRRPIGPGWSSFAVHGGFLYTQEQRGDDELVSCYLATTGAPVWRHSDAVRFWESNAGAGPRATPTWSDGRVYTLGATGILNALDAGDGAVVWSRDVTADAGKEVPNWGFASSPLVVGDLVVVAAGGRLVAYDRAEGGLRWVGPDGGGYASPHLATIDGVEQIVLLNGPGAIGVAPADGTLLWQHAWDGSGLLQPARAANGDLLISGSDLTGGAGIRRIAVARGADGWTTEERWTSRGLKPYFSDYVVHEGHAYGFDGNILSSIDLADGERAWKGGRYGSGQLLMLPDQDLLLVLSERGELALVAAKPDEFTELARFPAIEGKTWNHPVLVGDLLLVRNGQEMAAFRLALEHG